MPDSAHLLDSLLADDTEQSPALPGSGTTLRFTIAQFALRALLDKAAVVIPTRDVMPVLKNFHIDVRGARLRVTATDMELSMVCTTPMVTVRTEGTAVFPARKMQEILREADSGTDVTVRVTNNTAHISVGRAAWTLKLAGGHDYPAMPAITDVAFTTVDRAAFHTALATVRYAASRDANRASLNIIDVRGARMTACDGSRFQQTRTEALPFDLRIPIAAADHLTRLLKLSDQEHLHIGVADNHLIFRLGADVFIVNKFHAAFPDMEATLLRPALANRHTLAVDRAVLAAVIKRVRINADRESSAIALTLSTDSLAVTARDKYGNDATEPIPANWSGATRTIVVNHQFLTDLLGAYAQPVCQFRLGDDTRTRKSSVMLVDDGTGAVGVVQQMLADWVGQ